MGSMLGTGTQPSHVRPLPLALSSQQSPGPLGWNFTILLKATWAALLGEVGKSIGLLIPGLKSRPVIFGKLISGNLGFLILTKGD